MIANFLYVQLDFIFYEPLIPAEEKVREWIIKNVYVLKKIEDLR